MTLKKADYAIFSKFNFKRKPIAVKYSINNPTKMKPTNKLQALCELINEAQTGPPFCMFKTPGANRRIYDYVPHFAKDAVKYITCATVDKMTFEPDLLIFTTDVPQAEILLRASSFHDGKMWHSQGSTCLACAWIFAHPYLNGRMNYTVSGLGYSMKARQALPEGHIIIVFPFDQISSLVENLNDMEWEPDFFRMGRDGFIEAAQTREKELTRQLSLDYVQTTKPLKRRKNSLQK
jgi:uncharacterized protein (DUF169 family)